MDRYIMMNIYKELMIFLKILRGIEKGDLKLLNLLESKILHD